MMTVKNFDQKGASPFGLPVSDKSGGLNLLGKGSGGNIGLGSGGIGLGKGDDIAQPGIAPERDRRAIEDSYENHDADADDIYAFDPDDYSYRYSYYYDYDEDGGTDTLSLTGVGADEVRVRRGPTDSRVYIEAYDSSFKLQVQVSGADATERIERFHFDQNGNGIEDDGDDNILTNDELLSAATEDMAIYVNHGGSDWFLYRAGDGHQLIGDQDNNRNDILRIIGWGPDDVILTRNNDDLVRDYNYTPRNDDDPVPVRTYDDLQLEFLDGKTILLKHALDGSNRGVDRIQFDSDGDGAYEAIWYKREILSRARALVPQSSEDQFFHGFARDDTYIYSRGDGHDTIFEDDDAGHDILVLRGISSSDVIVSYSNASDSYIDSYINASDYNVGDTTNPDLLLEFGGRGTAATGSVLLALGAVHGFGIDGVHFDSNNNGIVDGNEISWDKAAMLAAAEATAAEAIAASDVYVFNPGDYSSYHWGYYRDRDGDDGDGGTDTLRLRGVGEDEVYVRRGPYIGGDFVFIEAKDNSFTLLVPLSGDRAIERFHFDQNGNGDEDDGDDNILTNNELLTMVVTENRAIYVDSPDSVSRNEFFYDAGDGHLIISDEDNNAGDYLVIYGWSADQVTLTRNNDFPVGGYNTGNADDPVLVRTYDDLQLEFTDGKTILLKHVLDGSNRGVDYIDFDLRTRWDKADMIAMARALVPQSSEDQFFHGLPQDDSYEYSRGDGHDTIFEDDDAGNDVLVLKGGISSSDITVSYSNAGLSYINASDHGASGIADPDLLIEFEGRGDEASGSVLLVLGVVDGFGIESILFDSNNNGITDAGEMLWDKADMLAAAEATAAIDDDYYYDPGRYSRYPAGYHYDEDADGGIDTLRLRGIGADEVRVRRGYYGGYDDAVYIDANDNSFNTFKVQLGGDNGIERVHFDKNRNSVEDDGDDNILTKDELLSAFTENMAIYVDHPGRVQDRFYYRTGDGHQIIGDQDNGDADRLKIYGWFDDEVILTRNNDAPVRDYNARNGEDLVRTYDDLQLEFPDGQTILLKYVLEGSDRGVDEIYFHGIESTWTKAYMIEMARDLVTQSSDDQFFHGFSFAEDNSYIYSRGDGHDTIFEDDDAGNDVLVLKGGISSGDVTVSYSNAGRSYIDASDYGAGDIAYPDLLLEFGGRGDAATGSVLLALGAVDGFGVESVLFDTNDNDIADGNEILWDRDAMLGAADATAAADGLFG